MKTLLHPDDVRLVKPVGVLVTRFRLNLCLSGMGGLVACFLLAGLSAWLIRGHVIRPLLPHPLVTLLCVLVFGAFSLAEVPLMLFTLRRLTAEQRGSLRVVYGLNGLYISFAAVYGAPVLLLTGNLAAGLCLCGLGTLRFATSLIWVREPSP